VTSGGIVKLSFRWLRSGYPFEPSPRRFPQGRVTKILNSANWRYVARDTAKIALAVASGVVKMSAKAAFTNYLLQRE
jgi:hypothetical protein